jgi:NAD(P)H-hydrate epimerase
MNITPYTDQIIFPHPGSHKGQNGRVLVIGGSRLFHAAPFWAATMASKIVDLVHFSSPAIENNDLVRQRAKDHFWDGIVVPWEEVDRYISEDDCILIGPGMPRDEGLAEGEIPSREIVNSLLRMYPDKKWVVDGGALQTVDPELLTPAMIATPNARELEIVSHYFGAHTLKGLVPYLPGVTILAKGHVDVVSDGRETVEIPGGDAGLTKGGTGDVLAGLVAGLYATSPALPSAVVASRVNKQAGENLAQKMGPFYNATDLIPEVQIVLKDLLNL